MTRVSVKFSQSRVYLVEQVGPDYVEELEGAEETIEDVVGREHAEELDSIEQGGVEDPGRVHSTPVGKQIGNFS